MQQNTVKFFWNGLKVNGEFHKCYYSSGPYTAASGLPEGTITMYAANYKRIPRIPELNIENETDIMIDYFESDRIRILPSSPLYNEAKKALRAHEIHSEKRRIKNIEKNLVRIKGTRHEAFYQEELRSAQARLRNLEACA